MKVRLTLIGPLKLPPQGRILESQVRKGTKVGTVLHRLLGYTEKEMRFVQVICSGRPVHLDDVIMEDMKLDITLRLGGG